MATYIIASIVILLFILAVVKIFKDRKKGGCGCGCSSCSEAHKCHANHSDNN